MLNGLLLIDKEPGCTSHDVVQRVRRLARQKRIGHCGTLDPDATGLLLLTLDQATRLTRFLIRAPKVYDGRMKLGVATDTYDASGRVTAEASAAGLDAARVALEMKCFVGCYLQTSPPYSAKKVKGVKLYELARRGEEVPESQKEVQVYEFGPTGELVDDELGFRLSCESGTYARSLAHDLGARLGCGAHLVALRRSRIGPFAAADAVTLDELDRRLRTGADLGSCWIPFDRIPLPFGEVVTDATQERRIAHGQTILVRGLSGEEGDWVRLANPRQQTIAVGTVIERIGGAGIAVVQPRIVFKAGVDGVVEFPRT